MGRALAVAVVLLVLLFLPGCVVEPVDCSTFLSEEKYSYSSYVGCKTREAVALAVNGDVQGAVEACKEIKNIPKGKIGGLTLYGYEEYNNCITQVAVVLESPSICSYTEENSLLSLKEMFEKVSQLIPMGSDLYTGQWSYSGTKAMCETMAEQERKRSEGMRHLWENIMEGFRLTFSGGG